MPDSRIVVGLDLSLRCTGMVALPLDFAEHLDWPRVHTAMVGQSLPKTASESKRCTRMRAILGRVVAFVTEHNPVAVHIEEQAFAQHGAMSREIAGLTWLVRVALHEAGFDVRPAPSTTVRKSLLGRNPRSDAKAHVQAALQGLGCPFHDEPDLCDAFAVASYGLADHGGRSVMLGGFAA